jgi:hypothetical protein
MGDLHPYFRHYEEQVGRAIDAAALRSYTVLSMLL